MVSEKILIFGEGYIGNRLGEYFEAPTTRVDISDLSALRNILNELNPTLVINAAAKTNTNALEKTDLQALAFQSNVQGPANLAYLIPDYGYRLVHISTGMMFDRSSPNANGWRENDYPHPTSFYTWTKALADWQLYPYLTSRNILITRIHLPISEVANPRNLLNKLLKFTNVVNAQSSATVLEDYLKALDKLIFQKESGIFNVVNPGSISLLEMAELLFKYGLIKNMPQAISREKLQESLDLTEAAFQTYPILNTDKLVSVGVKMPEIKIAVENCILRLKNEN